MSNTLAVSDVIPNDIHFIFFGFTEFGFIHYLAVKTALDVHKPDNVYLHYTRRPHNNPLWNEIEQLVTLVYVEPPEEFGGVKLERYQYKADITRLDILIRQGGIYMDIDVLSLKPFGSLLNHSCVLGVEACPDPNSVDLDQALSITNAVLMCKPNHPFMIDWLERTADNLINKPWAYHAVCLPLNMVRENKYNVRLEPRKSFMPFDFRDDYIFKNDQNRLTELSESYTVHLWETIWWANTLSKIDKEYLRSSDSLFAGLFKKHIGA